MHLFSWVRDKVLTRDIESLLQYESPAPFTRRAVPRAEHFIPLLIALGSGSPDREIRALYDTIEHGTLCTLCFQF
ncbi:hypothetical protein [Paenibacillus koleovorans]|uniref:hypothetical protein n=1 Tax=Paenibacillus koleovorans TaxID=121608 RepID=UPI000FD73F18|nr:hypothetical protein [Paenibacillus koleovorans]